MVVVAQVPRLAGEDGLAATPAHHLTARDEPCPLCSELLVCVAVAALRGGAHVWLRR